MATESDMVLANVDRARVLLAAARDAPDAKRIADMARAAEVYARRQKLSEEIIRHANAIKVDALTLMGEFLKANPTNKGANGSIVTGTRRVPVKDEAPTLAESGISKKESSTAKALATLKEAKPELHEKLKAGTLTIPQARREVIRGEKRADLEAKAAASPPATDWRIIEADCLEYLEANIPGTVWPTPTTDDHIPRLIFADPPYNIGVSYGDHHDDLMSPGDYLDWCESWIGLCAKTLKPDGSLWLMINHESGADFEMMVREAGLTVRAWITWYETFGVNVANNFNRTSRRLLYAVNDPKHFVFNADAVNRPSDRQAKYGDRRADPGGKTWDDVWGINPPIPRLVGNHAERLPDFPTQLPLDLLRAVVGCASEPGDLVLDPFSGSGTTGAAAIELGRRYVGIEKSAEFARISRQRLAAVPRRERNA